MHIPKRRHAVAADKNCIQINTHESRFSKSTEWIKSKNVSLERSFKAQGSEILVSRLLELSVRKSRCKCLHIYSVFNFEIAAYYLPELRCLRQKTCFSGTKTSFGSRETYLESLLKVLGRKIIFYVFISSFTSEISHVISQHGWFILGAPAADKTCIHNAL